MQIQIHKATDPEAAETGSFAFTSVVEAFREAGLSVPGEVDPDLFTSMWSTGMLLVFGAWEDGRMVGCRVVVLSPNFFNPKFKLASTVSLFVAPGARARGVAKQLMQVGDQTLREQGAVASVVQAFKAQTPSQIDGYKPAGNLWERTL